MGLLVFMTAFTYMMASVPGIFVPYQSTSIDLGSVVYRTSSILVEDPGWFTKNIGVTNFSYSNWEQGDNWMNVTRVGLAADKRSPNVLSLNKIHAIQQLPYLTVRDTLGLNNTIMYNFSLSLIEMKPGVDNLEILNFSQDYYTGIVESIDRIVQIREGEGLLYNCGIDYNNGRNNSIIYNDPYLSGNISIRIQNLSGVPDGVSYPVKVQFYYDNSHNGVYSSTPVDADYTANDYYIYKNNQLVADAENAWYNSSDTIDVIVDADKIRENYEFDTLGFNLSTVRVVTASSRPCMPGDYEGYNRTNPVYNYYQYPGILTLRVWQV